MTETNNKSPKISVIVPVYNSEKYLPKCIDSILSQTYTDFELILVNDGSKDGSGDICDEYAQKDTRVRVFHKENGGVSSARNLGLEEAKGEWIAFVDSDDWVEEGYLKELYDDTNLGGDLIIHGSFTRDHEKRNNEVISDYKVYSTQNRIDFFETLKISFNGFPVSKLYNNYIVRENKIKFPLGVSLSEDTIFILNYCAFIDSVLYRDKINYRYELVEDSLSNKSVFDYESNKKGLQELNNIIRNLYPDVKLRDYKSLSNTYTGFLVRCINSLNNDKSINRSLRLKKYKELHSNIIRDINYNGFYGLIKKHIYKLFFKRQFKLFDLLINSAYRI